MPVRGPLARLVKAEALGVSAVKILQPRPDLTQVLITRWDGAQQLYDIWNTGEVTRTTRPDSYGSTLWGPPEDATLEEVRRNLGSRASELNELLRQAI
jgi:hypothetical protein